MAGTVPNHGKNELLSDTSAEMKNPTPARIQLLSLQPSAWADPVWLSGSLFDSLSGALRRCVGSIPPGVICSRLDGGFEQFSV